MPIRPRAVRAASISRRSWTGSALPRGCAFDIWRDASVGLEPVRLIPVTPQVGKAYYQAENALQVLDLIEASEGGSNLLHWWRRWESNPRPEILGSRHLHQ